MGRVKGCVNDSCSAHQKHVKYKEDESYCSICGEPLAYVCRDCYTPLPNAKEKYCVRCRAVRDDRRDKVMKKAAKIGTGVVAGVGTVLVGGKKILEIVKDLK